MYCGIASLRVDVWGFLLDGSGDLVLVPGGDGEWLAPECDGDINTKPVVLQKEEEEKKERENNIEK